MDPVLIDTEVAGWPLTVESYAFFMGLGAAVALLVTWLVLRRVGLPVRPGLGILALTLVSIPVGARLLNIASKPGYYADHPDLMWTPEPLGFSLMGGLLLAVAMGTFACRRTRIDPWRLADAAAPGVLVGLAVMRVGCFLAGCCFGEESTLPWAVQFPYGSPAFEHYQAQGAVREISLFSLVTTPTVHPTQLYELVGSLAAAGLAAYLLHRKAAPGVAFLSAALAFCVTRLANHVLRVPSATDEIPDLAYPLLYLVLIVGAAAFLRRMRAQSPQSVTIPLPGGSGTTSSPHWEHCTRSASSSDRSRPANPQNSHT